MEEWMPINNFPKYHVSDKGNVKNIITGRILKPRKGHEYPNVSLYNDEGRFDKNIHRLEMEAFYGKYPELDINHIDGNKRNNRLDNLEYCTRGENISHAFKIGLKKPSGPYEIRKVKIIETGEVYESIRECARAINGSEGHISRCLNGIYRQYRGLHFEYIY